MFSNLEAERVLVITSSVLTFHLGGSLSVPLGKFSAWNLRLHDTEALGLSALGRKKSIILPPPFLLSSFFPSSLPFFLSS